MAMGKVVSLNGFNTMNTMKLRLKPFHVFLIVFVLFLLPSFVFTVQSGTRKLVFSAGKLTSVGGRGAAF